MVGLARHRRQNRSAPAGLTGGALFGALFLVAPAPASSQSVTAEGPGILVIESGESSRPAAHAYLGAFRRTLASELGTSVPVYVEAPERNIPPREGSTRTLGPIATLLAPIGGMVLQFAVSRTREFKADATGAEISGRPLALASALQKLKASARRVPMMIPPSVGAVVQVAPLPALGGGVAKLFSTHPATAARMERLQQIATKMDKG